VRIGLKTKAGNHDFFQRDAQSKGGRRRAAGLDAEARRAGDHFVAGHAIDGALFGDGFLYGGRERLHPLHGGGMLPAEIEHHGEIFLQIVGSHVRQGAIEIQIDGGAGLGFDGGRDGLIARRRGILAIEIEVHAVAPTVAFVTAAIDIHGDLALVKLQARDLHFIADIGGRLMTLKNDFESFFVERLAGLQMKTASAAGQRRDDFCKLAVNEADQGETRFFLQCAWVRGSLIASRAGSSTERRGEEHTATRDEEN
jgi:hypothetical protein